MRLLSFLIFLSCFSATVSAQSDSLYQSLVAEAGFFHLRKDHRQAIKLYEQAFRLLQPDALTAYKAAAAYALDSSVHEALSYLELALKRGWAEADWLLQDSDFDFLRSSRPTEWKNVMQQAFLREAEYAKSLKRPALRKQINLMAIKDQMLRYQRIRASEDERESINQKLKESDSVNLVLAKQVIKKYGWPKLSEIGKDGQRNLWLIVQHADHNVIIQRAALGAMEKLIGSTEIDMENYAFLYDRVQCNLNFKQLYGTQVLWTSNGAASGFRRIIREDLADERRKKLGLLPLNIYALSYGFHYKYVTKAQAMYNDSIDVVFAKQMIDSANYFFSRGEFQKTYDLYNAASTIPGGMTNDDNYNAAIVFAKVSAITGEQQYKDIALDFLSLLHQRQFLTKKLLKEQTEFQVLFKEKRWISLVTYLD